MSLTNCVNSRSISALLSNILQASDFFAKDAALSGFSAFLVPKFFEQCSEHVSLGTACARKCQENVSGDDEDLAPAAFNADADADDRAELERDEDGQTLIQ